MKQRYVWVFGLALVAGAALLTATAAASAAAILGGRDAAIGVPQRHQGPPPGPMPHGGPGGPGGLEGMVFELNLTSAQIQQVKALRESERTASETYREQVRTADEGIRAAIESGSFDEEAVRTLATAQAKAMAELRVIQARTESQIYNLLTAEQKATLKSLRPPKPPGEQM